MYKITGALLIALSLYSSEIVEISAKQEKELGIQTQALENIEKISLGSFNAKVMQSQNETHYLSTKVAGVVQEIYTQKFAHVKKGQKLLKLQSSELLNLQKEYIDADIQNAAAKKSYERDLKLEQKGVIAKKRLLESQRLFDSAKVLAEINAQELLAQGISKEELQKIQKTKKPTLFVALYAPVSGQVFALDAAIGESVGAQKNLVGIYAESGKYLEIALPLRVAQKVSLGDLCLFGDEEARVVGVSDLVEEDSQAVLVHAELQNPNASKIHQIYEVKILKDVESAWKLKKTSVVFVNAKAYVFRRVAQGFELVDVEIISEEPSFYVVRSESFKKGESVASSATAALLGALGKEDE